MPHAMLASLIGAAFAKAPLDHSFWHSGLSTLASASRSARGQLIGLGKSSLLAFNHISGDTIDQFDRCAEIGGYGETVNFRIAASLQAIDMEVIDDRRYAQITPSLSDERYVQFCNEIDIPFGCQTKLLSGGGAMIGLALLRTQQDGAIGEAERTLFEAVAPYVKAAVRTQIALRHEGHSLLVGAFEGMSTKALICDGFGLIRAVTPKAEAWLARSTRLRVRDRTLESAFVSETRRIHAMVARIIAGNDANGAEIVLPTNEDGAGLRLILRSLPSMDWGFGHAPRAVIVIQSVDSVDAGELTAIAARFGLTQAEAEVAGTLAAGLSRARVAQLRGVSLDTVKTQLKSIFLKMDLKREAELTARLRSLL